MTGLTLLITGMSRFVGSQLAGQLAEHPGVRRVIGVDAALPEPAARARMGAADFARVDIRNPLIAKVIDAAGVDTVVHASASSTPVGAAARTMAKEMNVLGTMQLLAACQRADSVQHLVVRSTASVYGGSAKDPAILTEDTAPRAAPSGGPGRDAVDIEGYVRGFARRRPDVRVVVPRLAEVVGPTVDTPLTRYFALAPFVPIVFGRDARLQVVHEQDAVDVLAHLALGSFRGTVNVAGDGVLTVVQAIHRAGRLPLPLPSLSLGPTARLLRIARLQGFSPAQLRLLTAGRVLDTTRLKAEAGFTPAFTTAAAFDDFARTLRPALPVDLGSGGTVAAAPTAGPARSASGSPAPPAPPIRTAVHADTSSVRAAAGRDVGGRPAGRPKLVGIAGDGPGTPRPRRTR